MTPTGAETGVDLTVARITRPHALRGEVGLEIRTDVPEQRLRPGAVFATSPPGAGPLTLKQVRHDSHGWFARFAEIGDRDAAEAARGVELLTQVAASDEPDAWYPHELDGLTVTLVDGTDVGVCVGVEHFPAQDALKILQADGDIALVPLVTALVPLVDVAGGRIVVDPPLGLLAVAPVPDADTTVDEAAPGVEIPELGEPVQ